LPSGELFASAGCGRDERLFGHGALGEFDDFIVTTRTITTRTN
jgi:hypothetical protein